MRRFAISLAFVLALGVLAGAATWQGGSADTLGSGEEVSKKPIAIVPKADLSGTVSDDGFV